MGVRKIFGKLRHHPDLPAALLVPAPLTPAAGAPSLYPPVVASMTAKSKASRQRRIEGHYSRVHAQTDIATKLRLITGLRRLKYVVPPQSGSVDADRWYQHFTKTAYVQGLPQENGPMPGAEGMAGLRSLLCEALLQEQYYTTRGRCFMYRSHEVSAVPFLTNAVSILSSQCARYNPSLTRCTLDMNPQVNFYWLRGETKVPRGHRKGCIDPIRFQVNDSPLLQIRMPKPLKEFVPLERSLSEEVPVVPYEPSRVPLFQRQYENNIFIGAKLDDPCSFGHTQFHIVPDKFSRERLQKLNREHHIEVFLRANAIASLFAWTGAQAMYQGFWSMADLTRPFVSQGVISDGKHFSFFCYQLNTLALAVDADKDPNRKNICWGTKSTPLFDTVEEGDIKGFNEDVFRQLVDFFLNSPA